MLFHLQNGELVTLPDDCTDLSEFFVKLQSESTPVFTMEEHLKRLPEFRKVRLDFVTFLQSVLTDHPTEENLKQLNRTTSTLHQELIDKFKDHPQEACLKACLEYVRQHMHLFFEQLVHRLKFIKDDVLLFVFEFLQIRSSLRNVKMFEYLPFAMHGCGPTTDLKSVMDPNLHPYIDFVRKLSDEMVLELAKAASLLGIHPLSVLLGCKMASIIMNTPESEVRKRFSIPEKYKDSTLEKLNFVISDKSWLKHANSDSLLVKEAGQSIDIGRDRQQ